MKLTKDWLDIHLKSKKKESQIIDKLNNIGLEVEKIEPISENHKYELELIGRTRNEDVQRIKRGTQRPQYI